MVTEATKVAASTATVSITDAEGTELTAAALHAIGGSTSGTVTVTNAVDIDGAAADVTAALVTEATKVAASTATVTIDDTPTITQLNNIAAATNGVVTSSISGTGTALEALNTGANDNITVTVSDYVSISQLEDLNDKTSGTVTATLRDTAANFATLIARGSSVYGPLLQQATKTQITNYVDQDLSALAANGLVSGGLYGDPTIELLVATDTSLDHTDDAANLIAVDTIVLTADNTDLTLSADSFASNTATTHFKNLTGITSTNSNVTAVIADNGISSGSTIDLSRITSVTGLDLFHVNGDSGANVITLSKALSQSGTTRVSLGNDSAEDQLILKADTSDYSSTDGDSLAYTEVVNFDVTTDKFNVKYGSDNALADSNSYLNTSSTLGSVVDLANDRTVVEQDSVRQTAAGTAAFDTVAEVQTLIADSIEDVPGAADKVLNIFYGYNTETDVIDGYVVASSMGALTTADLAGGDNFSVMSLARIVNINYTAFAEDNLATS